MYAAGSMRYPVINTIVRKETAMAFILSLAQAGYPENGDVLAQAERFASQAEAAGAALLVFPEDFMSPRKLSRDEAFALAEPLDGPFVRGMCELARAHGLWIVFTMSEVHPEGLVPFNTAIAVDDAGQVRGTYRKTHLYDAHKVRESDRMTAGDALGVCVETSFGTLGLSICYDLRFPEVARAAAVAGCDVLLYPSAWHAGPCKPEHWETLLRARAIENELFVAGVCKAGPKYVGRSLVADPLGQVIARGSDCTPEAYADELVCCEVDLAAIASAREAMPVFAHRRTELY